MKITGNEVYSEVSPTRYGKDMLAMKAMLAQAWARLAPAQQVPKLIGPDNGADDMSAEHLDGILSAVEGVPLADTFGAWATSPPHTLSTPLLEFVARQQLLPRPSRPPPWLVARVVRS